MPACRSAAGRARLCVLLELSAATASLGCSPVRPGTYQGNLYVPVNFNYDYSRGLLSGLDLQIFRDWPGRPWLTGPPEKFQVSLSDPSSGGAGQFRPWIFLADALGARTPIDARSNAYGSTVVMGVVTGVVDYVFVACTGYPLVQPIGASGPSIFLQPGFHILHRTCQPDEPNHFEEVPLDTAVTYRADDASALAAGRDPYAAACALPLSAAVDLGDAMAVLPASSRAGAPPLGDLVWSPAVDSVYFLAGVLGEGSVQVLRADVGQLGATQIMFGDLYGPLRVATHGTNLLVNQAGLDNAPSGNIPYGTSLLWSRSLRQSLVAGAITPLAVLPEFSGDGVLSPDGTLLAVASQSFPVQTQLIDVAKATVSVENLGSGTPLAWDPSGQSLVVVDASSGPPRALSLDGRSTPLVADASAVPVLGQYFWGASGPKAVIQDAAGTRVHDLVTGQITELVEASRVAPSATTVAAVVATEQVFAWALECFGIGETSCNAELRRLSLATGARDVVARAGAGLPFAVSPDGTRLALADSKNLYLKSLSP